MKVVLDTNVLVSGLLKSGSVPGRLLQAVWSVNLELLLSAPLRNELANVPEYPKIRKRLIAQSIDVTEFLERLPFFTTDVTLGNVSVPMPRDVDDWKVLATFVAGRGDWLVTGDADLLVMNDQFSIVTPTVFVERFLA